MENRNSVSPFFGELTVTVVGNDIYDQVIAAIKEACIRINPVNPVKQGRLGNFMTLTVTCSIPDDEIITKRRTFMDILCKEGSNLTAMYEHGDWMRVYIFKKTAWKSREEQRVE